MKAYKMDDFTERRSPATHLRVGLYTIMLLAVLVEVLVG